MGLFAATLRAMQRKAAVPEPLFYIPQPLPAQVYRPAADCAMSFADVALWLGGSCVRRPISSWRAHWARPTAFGAVTGPTIGDVSTDLGLQFEQARHEQCSPWRALPSMGKNTPTTT